MFSQMFYNISLFYSTPQLCLLLTGKLKEDIVSAGVLDELKSMSESHTDVKVKEQARSTLNTIEESMSVG